MSEEKSKGFNKFFDEFNSLAKFIFTIVKLVFLGLFILFIYSCSKTFSEIEESGKVSNSR